jgi:hypothetical protein
MKNPTFPWLFGNCFSMGFFVHPATNQATEPMGAMARFGNNRPPTQTPVLGRFDAGARIPNAPLVAEMLAGSPQARPGSFRLCLFDGPPPDSCVLLRARDDNAAGPGGATNYPGAAGGARHVRLLPAPSVVPERPPLRRSEAIDC